MTTSLVNKLAKDQDALAVLAWDAWIYGKSSEGVKKLGGMRAYVGLVATLPAAAIALRVLDTSVNTALAGILLLFLKMFEQQLVFVAKKELTGEMKERVVSGVSVLTIFSMMIALIAWFVIGGLVDGGQ